MDIVLEPEQEKLLAVLVEAANRVSREHRQKFFVVSPDNTYTDFLQHDGLPGGTLPAYSGDYEALARAGLLAVSKVQSGAKLLDVTPLGFAHYRNRREALTSVTQRIETSTREYLEGTRFFDRFPAVARKIQDAEKVLWDEQAAERVTTVGHLCREALQEFATALVKKVQPQSVDPDKAKTVARLKSVVNAVAPKLGDTTADFLAALISYWGTVSDLVQRAEHAAAKEGTPLEWEDARRIVFQSFLIMYEVDRALFGHGAK